MASLIPGYEYDIFISYRQKDNKGDRWVSEFVETLKTELESTFKEEISVYFDMNQHDGLLETHDVDASLNEKLKCLVFIPIISRTYCDPKSFAWEHEFKAFVEQASQDQFGLKVKLPSGNVASRVLPVQIHDLNREDKVLVEEELTGYLRAIEFIYKEPGVNRPLKQDDDDKINLNKTKYRNQINKVANAIDEIISCLKSLQIAPEEKNISSKETKAEIEKKDQRKGLLNTAIISRKSKKRLIMLFSVILCVISAFIIIKIIDSSKQNRKLINPDKTIAVLPFRNLTTDTTQLYFCDGFMEELLNNLQKVKSFTVRSRTSSDQYRDTKKSISTIGNELNVNYLVEGSVGREGNNLKIWVQLIDSKADKHVWSNEYLREMTIKQIFSLQSEISEAIAAELEAVITPQEKQLIERTPTDNLEAYRLYMVGNSMMTQMNEDSYRKAINNYHQAIKLDSGFAQAYAGLASCFLELSMWDVAVPSTEFIPQARAWAVKALEINKNLAEAYFVIGSIKYIHEWDWNGAEQAFKKGMELNPNYVYGRISYANFLTAMGRFKESVTIGQQTLKRNPLDPGVYNELAFAMFFNDQHEEAIELANKGLTLKPNFDQTLGVLAQFYAWKGLFDQAMFHWKKIIFLNDNDIRKISSFFIGFMGQAFGVAGHKTEVIPFLDELNRRAEKGDYVANTLFAFLYRALGENEKAIDFFEKGFNEKEPIMLWINIFYKNDSIQSNTRFKELLRKMRF